MKLPFIYCFRIYPSDKVIDFLNMHAGHSRFVWNKLLERAESFGKYENINLMQSYFTEELRVEYPWITDSNSTTLRHVIYRLDCSIKHHQRNLSEKPRFKKRLPSYSLYFRDYKLDKIKGILRLPKLLGEEIPIRIHRDFEEPDVVKIIRSSDNKFYAMFRCKEYYSNIPYKPKGQVSHLGIDLGLKDIVTTSDNRSYGAPKFIRKAEENLKRKRRALDNKTPGSREWEKARIRLARAEHKVKNQRNDFNHKLSVELAKTSLDGVGVETLLIRNMVRNPKLSKSILDASLANLVGMLNYKLKKNGKVLTFVSRYFPSTKTCFNCENKSGPKNIGSLGTRIWKCSECGSENHRDINAAKNIAREADRIYTPPYYLKFCGRAFRKLPQTKFEEV